MQAKWLILCVFVSLYLFGMIGVGMHTYSAVDPSSANRVVETIKILFIMLGGLGVILPTYLNVWQSMEASKIMEDAGRKRIIENTFDLFEKWDDKALFDARKFSRELKERCMDLSPNQLVEEVRKSPELKQSVVLLFNYFELVRMSIEYERVDRTVVKEYFSRTLLDICGRFAPWVQEQSASFQRDVEKLKKLLAD